MIRLEDLKEAIAECEGERDPNANTCIKLAAYYTIMENLYGSRVEAPTYSYAAPEIEPQRYKSGTEFAMIAENLTKDELMPVFDELMDTIQMIQPRLYDSVMKKFHKKY